MGTLLRPQITVHLNAVCENYARIRKYAPNAEICPVVKSNAYGLGAVEIVRALIACGCRNFYVSTPLEGVELRNNFPDIQINVLNGLQNGSRELFRNYRLTPVINSVEQMKRWECMAVGAKTDCVLNIETGFNRLGLPEKNWALCTSERLKNARVSVIMTHFSCVSESLSGDIERNCVIEEQNRRQYAAYFNGFNFPEALRWMRMFKIRQTFRLRKFVPERLCTAFACFLENWICARRLR